MCISRLSFLPRTEHFCCVWHLSEHPDSFGVACFIAMSPTQSNSTEGNVVEPLYKDPWGQRWRFRVCMDPTFPTSPPNQHFSWCLDTRAYMLRASCAPILQVRPYPASPSAQGLPSETHCYMGGVGSRPYFGSPQRVRMVALLLCKFNCRTFTLKQEQCFSGKKKRGNNERLP